MTNLRMAVALAFGLGVSMCGADEPKPISSPKASLEASLSGGEENPMLSIRLRNIGHVPIVADRALVFLPNIVLTDNQRRVIPLKEIHALEKPEVSVLKSRLATLKPGEEIKRQVHLRKGFKCFVTGSSIPVRPGGGEPPKVTAYEALYQMPTDMRPFEIEVSYKPAYSFEEGFMAYMQPTNVAQFYRGPLRVSVPYKLAEDARGGY